MPRVYELPTHLEVEDTLIAGLTARQLVRLMLGASLAYGLWDQVGWLPDEVRLPLAIVLAILGVLVALVQPAGRPLDQWLLAGLLFVALPRRLVWRPGALDLRQPQRDQSAWAELSLQPAWVDADVQQDVESTRGPERRRPWWRRRA
jgi:hypothetical protein